MSLKGQNGIIFGSTGFLGKEITNKLESTNENIIIQGKTLKNIIELDYQ